MQEQCSRLCAVLSRGTLDGMVEKARTARSLAREAVHASILAAARARLTEEGPAQLSLRAVARDVGLVSSAVYRYFPSRDDLLTALLVLDYDELGAAVEAAEAPVDRSDHVGRWVAACRAVRQWAIGHPGDFALLYGSPVPGYVAPQDTVEPASRTTHVLVRVVTDAWSGSPGPSWLRTGGSVPVPRSARGPQRRAPSPTRSPTHESAASTTTPRPRSSCGP